MDSSATNHHNQGEATTSNGNKEPIEGSDDEIELRAAVQYAVMNILQAEEQHSDCRCKPSTVNSLSELVFLYATQSLGPDLAAFANHANHRKTVTEADVKLVARKQPELLDKMTEFCQQLQEEQPPPKKKSAARRRGASSRNSEFEEDEEEEVVNLQAKTYQRRQQPSDAAELWDNDSTTDDDDLMLGKTGKSRAAPKVAKRQGDLLGESSSSSSDEDLEKTKPRKTEKKPRRRFRLSGRVQGPANMDSSSGSDKEHNDDGSKASTSCHAEVVVLDDSP